MVVTVPDGGPDCLHGCGSLMVVVYHTRNGCDGTLG